MILEQILKEISTKTMLNVINVVLICLLMLIVFCVTRHITIRHHLKFHLPYLTRIELDNKEQIIKRLEAENGKIKTELKTYRNREKAINAIMGEKFE